MNLSASDDSYDAGCVSWTENGDETSDENGIDLLATVTETDHGIDLFRSENFSTLTASAISNHDHDRPRRVLPSRISNTKSRDKKALFSIEQEKRKFAKENSNHSVVTQKAN